MLDLLHKTFNMKMEIFLHVCYYSMFELPCNGFSSWSYLILNSKKSYTKLKMDW